MKNTSVEILDYYDEEVIKMITEKYGFEQMQALRIFLNSETYKLLSDAELEMWENEKDYREPKKFSIFEEG